MATAIDFFININLISETGALDGFFGVRVAPLHTRTLYKVQTIYHFNVTLSKLNYKQKYSTAAATSSALNPAILKIRVERAFRRLAPTYLIDMLLYVLPRFPPHPCAIYSICVQLT